MAVLLNKMDIKPEPNRKEYIRTLRRMTPGQRLAKAIELSDMGKELLRHGLRRRFPDLSEEELHKLYLERLEKCHNRNY